MAVLSQKAISLEHDIAEKEHVSKFFYGDFKAMNPGAVTGSRK